MTVSIEPGFLDDTVRVLLALRPKPKLDPAHPFSETQWFDQLYRDAKKLWEARERYYEHEAIVRRTGYRP